MRLSPALASMIICALLGACATQLDESGVPLESADPPGGASATAGKGGSVGSGASGGGAAVGGSGAGGKAGATGGSSGSPGKGGTASAGSGGSAESGNGGSSGGGSSGSSGNSGSSGTASIGSGGAGSTDCAALPLWMANAEPPNKPMLQGDELTYMNHRFAVEPVGAMISWWNDVCPPSGARETWCETDAQRYTDLGACE